MTQDDRVRRFALRMDVAGVADGVAAMKVTIERVDGEAHGAGEPGRGAPKGNEPGRAGAPGRSLASLAGGVFGLKIRDTGAVVEVSGFTDLIAGVLDNGENAGEAALRLREEFSDARVASMLEAAIPALPPESVAEGAVWSSVGVASLPGHGALRGTTRSRILAVGGEGVSFKTKTRFELPDGRGGGGIATAYGPGEVWDATTDGRSLWHPGEGRLTDSRTETRIVSDAHGRETETVVTTTLRWLSGEDAPEAGESGR